MINIYDRRVKSIGLVLRFVFFPPKSCFLLFFLVCIVQKKISHPSFENHVKKKRNITQAFV